MQTLVGGVDTTERRAKRHHVEIRILLGEQTTLQSGVDTQHLRIFVEQLAIGSYGQSSELAIGIHAPCGIALTLYHLGTS